MTKLSTSLTVAVSEKVYLTVPTLSKSYGGPARTVTGLYRHLSALQSDRIELWHGSSPDPVQVDGLKLRELMLPELMSTGAREISRGAIVHDNGLWTPWNVVCATLALTKRAHLVVSVRGMLEAWALNQKSSKKQLAWWLYQREILKRASLLVATASQEIESIRSLGIKTPVALLPNGVDVTGQPMADGFAHGQERVVLFLSRIHPKKGLEVAIDAWASVRPAGWKFRIVGSGDSGYISSLNSRIRELALKDSITIEGPLDGDEKVRAYRNAEIFMLPTFSENFGVVVAEALAGGTPVITTHGAPWAGLNEHGCGWWIPVGLEPLVTTLREVTNLPRERLNEMGKCGRAWIEQAYAWPAIAAQTLQAYDWITGGRSRASCPGFIELCSTQHED